VTFTIEVCNNPHSCQQSPVCPADLRWLVANQLSNTHAQFPSLAPPPACLALHSVLGPHKHHPWCTCHTIKSPPFLSTESWHGVLHPRFDADTATLTCTTASTSGIAFCVGSTGPSSTNSWCAGASASSSRSLGVFL
jgi:hypothetical protein